MADSVKYYDDHGERFVGETFDIDMSSVYQSFLELIPEGGRILDAGCGSGRDALAFSRLGFQVEAFDASRRCAELARELTGLQIQQQRFEEINFDNEFDGIWACASLIHVHRDELEDVLARFHRALRSRGVAYVSFKGGREDTQEGARSFTNFSVSGFRAWVTGLPGWTFFNAWLSEDLRPDRRAELWINGLIRKA